MIIQGDCIQGMKTLPDRCVQTCITSPPYYGLRDYGHNDQIGLEATPDQYVAKMVAVFREVRRVLRDDGTLWLNLGDSYAGPKGNTRGEGAGGGKDRGEAMFGDIGKRQVVPDGLKPKDLCGIPWRVAFALQADGWYLRQDIIWAKPNPMPESVRDRCTKAHEYIFLLSKSQKYYFDNEAIKEKATTDPTVRNKAAEGYQADYAKGDRFSEGERIYGADGMRNKRSVWTVNVHPYSGAHFATFPPKLIEPCVLAGCPVGGTVFDPFTGSGTTGAVALKWGRKFIGCELNSEYVKLAKSRISNELNLFT